MDTHQRLVNIAQGVFSQYGYRKATVDEIARRANKGKSSLYHYFKNKEEIFKAVIEKEVKELKHTIAKAVACEKSNQKRLQAYIVVRTKAIHHMANLFTAFRDEYLESYSFIERIRQEYDQYEIETLKKLLEAGISTGEYKVKDIDLTALGIFTAVKGLEYHWALQPDVKVVEEKITSLLDVLFYGIVAGGRDRRREEIQ